MRTFAITSLAALVLAAIVASVHIRRSAAGKVRENGCVLEEQRSEIAELLAINRRLSNQLASTMESSRDPAAELPALRNRVEALRRQHEQLTSSAGQLRPWRPSESSLNPSAGSTTVS